MKGGGGCWPPEVWAPQDQLGNSAGSPRALCFSSVSTCCARPHSTCPRLSSQPPFLPQAVPSTLTVRCVSLCPDFGV